MTNATRAGLLNDLRGKITSLEERVHLQDVNLEKTRAVDLDIGSLEAGLLHEVWCDNFKHAGAVFGFSLNLAHYFVTRDRPVILWLQLQKNSQEYGLPYPSGFDRFGIDPKRLVIGQFKNITDLLWAAEEVIGSSAIAAVMCDLGQEYKKTDFKATRRLALRAKQPETPSFLLRSGMERELSAAPFRWRVGPSMSAETPYDPRAPGMPAWHVSLEKGWQKFETLNSPQSWIVNWTENGFAFVPQGVNARGKQAIPGAAFAALGNGLSQTA